MTNLKHQKKLKKLLKKLNNVGVMFNGSISAFQAGWRSSNPLIHTNSMKLPKEIKIGGLVYKIEEKDLRITEVENNSGYCRVNDEKIVINSELTENVKESTLLHEIIEAINFNHQLELPHSTIMTLEATLYQVIKDNKLFK